MRETLEMMQLRVAHLRESMSALDAELDKLKAWDAGRDPESVPLEWKRIFTLEFVHRRHREELLALEVELESSEPSTMLVAKLEAWTPIKLRQDLLGDIREDVQRRRDQGWTSKRLKRLIWWQFGWAVASRVGALIQPLITALNSIWSMVSGG